MKQLITPEPRIPCQPGWCLAYVNEAYGVDKKYGSATDAWNGSTTKHEDHNYPDDLWVPLWFSLDSTPLGHVVLRAPGGSIFSTSDLSNKPYHHPSLEHLMSYYAYYGMTLTYLGWTEDVENTPVIGQESIFMTLTPQQEKDIYWELCSPDGRAERARRVADAILDTPVPTVNSQGKKIMTTLRTKIQYMAPNHEEIHNAVAETLAIVRESAE